MHCWGKHLKMHTCGASKSQSLAHVSMSIFSRMDEMLSDLVGPSC